MQAHTIAPQSIAKIKKATLTPHFKLSTMQQSCEQSKISLFASCKSEDIKLIFSENFYEPYFLITAKYTVDYVKKHSFTVELNDKIDRLYIAGKEILPEPNDSEKAIFKIAADQRAHIQNEAVLVLDKRMREVDGTTMPFSTSNLKNISESQKWQKIDIPTKQLIDLVKNKIVTRPLDAASIEKETFEITQRTIVYLPMCSFTFQNLITHEEAATTINRVTGEIDSITYKKNRNTIYAKLPNTVSQTPQTTFNLQPSHPSFIQDEIERLHNTEAHNTPEISLEGVPESMSLGFPAEIGGEIFSVGDNVTAVVGDIAIASGSIIDKSLVVKGSIKIGDNCIANGKLKVLKDVVIGTETVIDGDIVAGGNVFIGSLSKVKGRIEAAGFVQINEGAIVEKGLHCFSEDLEYDKKNLEKLREEVGELKTECAELNECLQFEVLV